VLLDHAQLRAPAISPASRTPVPEAQHFAGMNARVIKKHILPNS